MLLALLVSYLGWAYLIKNPDLVELIPNIGFMDRPDKKKIMLVLCKILLLLMLVS